MQMSGGHLRKAGWTALPPYEIPKGNFSNESLLAYVRLRLEKESVSTPEKMIQQSNMVDMA